MVSMEVVASAPLEGGYAALRIRSKATGPTKERIRAQLAMLGAPVLNDRAATTRPVDEEVARAAGLLPEPAMRMKDPELTIVPGGSEYRRGLSSEANEDSDEICGDTGAYNIGFR